MHAKKAAKAFIEKIFAVPQRLCAFAVDFRETASLFCNTSNGIDFLVNLFLIVLRVSPEIDMLVNDPKIRSFKPSPLVSPLIIVIHLPLDDAGMTEGVKIK